MNSGSDSSSESSSLSASGIISELSDASEDEDDDELDISESSFGVPFFSDRPSNTPSPRFWIKTKMNRLVVQDSQKKYHLNILFHPC